MKRKVVPQSAHVCKIKINATTSLCILYINNQSHKCNIACINYLFFLCLEYFGVFSLYLRSTFLKSALAFLRSPFYSQHSTNICRLQFFSPVSRLPTRCPRYKNGEDAGIWRHSLFVSLWLMTGEAWQWVGQVSPCGAVSYRSNRVSGAEMSINMHIKSDLSAGGILSLAEGWKVKLAYIRMMGAVLGDRLFLVICHQWKVRARLTALW